MTTRPVGLTVKRFGNAKPPRAPTRHENLPEIPEHDLHAPCALHAQATEQQRCRNLTFSSKKRLPLARGAAESDSQQVTTSILSVTGLGKIYKSGHVALRDINLEIKAGEIFALLGPNGAGKTTLISIICGLVNPTEGRVLVDGHDIISDYRVTRSKIGLVPQELATDMFETVWDTLRFSRGLFGKARNDEYLESVLRELSLWDKRGAKIMTLSGGMKRRVLIAKALSHEPSILFLDEPTAGVDVELRRDMWRLVAQLRDRGVTIILTTHYIEEAEEMADRVGVISKGRLLLVQEKTSLMKQLGNKTLTVHFQEPLAALPQGLTPFAPQLQEDGRALLCTFSGAEHQAPTLHIVRLLDQCGALVTDIETKNSSLEEIFVNLVHQDRQGQTAAAPPQ